jgi:hypothetical protein
LHQLTLKLDDTSDQLQLLIDDSLAFYSEDAQFSLASSITNQWWNSGWTLGSGGRRNNDFDGVITEFQVDDSAMFLSF